MTQPLNPDDAAKLYGNRFLTAVVPQLEHLLD